MGLTKILTAVTLTVNVLFFSLVFIQNPFMIQIFPNRNETRNEGAYSMTKKLYKIAWYNKPKWLPSSFNFSRCNFTNCELLTGHRKKINMYDAIIFHHRYLPNTVPQKLKEQIWIIWTAESPANEQPLPQKWHKTFDWSATYRRDSEIYIQRMIKQRKKHAYRNYSEIYRRKTKLIAWVVSNCKTPSKRQIYVKEMQKYVDVDVYGKCGNQNNICRNVTITECHILLSKDYKFYLGFENSICQDYFTEKVAYNFLDDNNMIYVVRGAPNLDELIPENTVIRSEEFRSAKDLSEYLLRLGSNEVEYVSFLKNKGSYYLMDNRRERAFCSLCELLQTYKKKKLEWTGRNFNHWYRNGACKQPSDLKKNNYK